MRKIGSVAAWMQLVSRYEKYASSHTERGAQIIQTLSAG